LDHFRFDPDNAVVDPVVDDFLVAVLAFIIALRYESPVTWIYEESLCCNPLSIDDDRMHDCFFSDHKNTNIGLQKSVLFSLSLVFRFVSSSQKKEKRLSDVFDLKKKMENLLFQSQKAWPFHTRYI